MAESPFPRPIDELITTLVEIYRSEQKLPVVSLLESSAAAVDLEGYDNWDGGMYRWALRLEAPVPVFMSIRSQLKEIEEDIRSSVSQILRVHPRHYIHEVTVAPLAAGHAALDQRSIPSDADVDRIWQNNRLRLFLSHVAKHKVELSAIKETLVGYGVSGFVAHEDVEPNRDWQNEIEVALRSMHALAAFLTPEFHESRWTDQEVGWAYGRGINVLAIRLGTDPYGFIGKTQAISGKLAEPHELVEQIVGALLRDSRTHLQMRRSLVSAFANSWQFEIAKKLRDIIITIKDFTGEEKAKLLAACEENGQVRDAWGVPASIREALGGQQQAEDQFKEDEFPF